MKYKRFDASFIRSKHSLVPILVQIDIHPVIFVVMNPVRSASPSALLTTLPTKDALSFHTATLEVEIGVERISGLSEIVFSASISE